MIQPVIDFHCSGAGRLGALKALFRVYPRYSPRRRAAFVVNAANLLTIESPPRTLARVRRALSDAPVARAGEIRAILMHKVAQNGRAYVFDFDRSARLRSVTKVALTEHARTGVAREHEVLLRLPRSELPFQVPEVLAFRESRGTCVLSMSATEEGLRIHDKSKGLPDFVFDAIAAIGAAGTPRTMACAGFTWFDGALARVTNARIGAVARQIGREEEFAVCAAHGDLGSENIFSSAAAATAERRFAVIDWESFAESAPAMTDRVSFWLGRHHRRFKREFGAWSGGAATSHFLDAFAGMPGGAPAGVVALLGLLHIGNDLAARLCGANP
jgi:hypothetical protein